MSPCCHSERSEESLIIARRSPAQTDSQRCFASLNMTETDGFEPSMTTGAASLPSAYPGAPAIKPQRLQRACGDQRVHVRAARCALWV